MYIAKIDDQDYEIKIDRKGVILNGKRFEWDITQLNENSYHIIRSDVSYNVEVESWDKKTKIANIKINGRSVSVEVKDKLDILLKELGMDKLVTSQINNVKAPMPGLILSMSVVEGQEVKKGDPLLILEAMKMENVIKSPSDGIVKLVKAAQGESVEKNQVLIQF
ncbi:MAG: acetyl-CoA carboxylase biotin carboxyl carrier protein subunit [Bacteroidota bacterium]